MELLFTHCAGMDVHKDSVVVCVRIASGTGPASERVERFGTINAELQRLRAFLEGQQVDAVAMESTGVFWKPIWNLLEGSSFKLILVNARHVKNVPGRKTDVMDCQWLAGLLAHGLVRGSFVPSESQRDLRDLTRQRAQLIGQRSRVVNRVQKVLEDAGIKLGSVASDVMGQSGRAMIEALVADNQTPEQMADLAKRALRRKIPELQAALTGHMRDHHRFMLRQHLAEIDHLDGQIAGYDQRIEGVLSPLEQAACEKLDAIPGIDRKSAQCLLAEIGVNMDQFPSAAHLCSWAGMCPGNHQSAGKRHSGRTQQGNRWLRRTLNQCAQAAARTKRSYFKAQCERLSRRRGRKRAIVAVGHSLLEALYYVLKSDRPYQDLGVDYFQKAPPEQKAQRLAAQLRKLGYNVTLEARPRAA